MPTFSYIVKDRHGKSFAKEVDIDSKGALIEKLQNQKFFIVSIKEIKRPGKKGRYIAAQKQRKFTHKKVKLDDLLTFSHQLATMMEAGVTLIRTLNVIQTQIESEQFEKTIEKIKNDVEQGSTLSLALSKHPKVFNQFWISLMEVGEASGTVPTVLEKLSFYLSQQAAFSSTIISGIIYPAILFLVAVGAVAFFALFVGPRFEAVFQSMGAELPLITTLLLSFFKFLKSNFLLINASIVAGFFLFKSYIATYNGKLMWEKFLFGLPSFGEVIRLIIVERFASQMAILIDAGVPILFALDITERLVDNNNCALIIKDIKESVREGELLVGPMERSGFFPPMCIQMIMVGEETGELSKMLKHVSAFYQDKVETFMKRFATIVEPFMLIFMGAIIGTIVLAMFLPMFNLGKLGGG